MGEIANKMLENATSSFSPDQLIGQIGSYFNGLLDTLVNMIPAEIMAIYNTHTALFLIAAICIVTLIAFEGYKLFKMVIYAGSAFLFGLIGYWYISPELEASIKPMIPDMIDYHVLVAIVCALVAVFLCRCAYNFMIMLLGGVSGFLLGSTVIYNAFVGYFNTLDFLKMDAVKYIIGGVFAVLFSILFILLFKHLFMLITSIGGMISAAVLLKMVLVPDGDETVKLCFIVLGFAVGILAVVNQYKEEEKAMEIVF